MANANYLWRGVLLDIEGTTSSISFVYDEMFPFARRHLVPFLRAHWDRADVAEAAEQIAKDAGAESLAQWAGSNDARAMVIEEVERLMDADVKATGLKQLQGLIWQSGFESGELKSHLYPDVAPALQQWQSDDLDVRIYSSGSVKAQLLFFGHSIAGNLLERFRGHYDTKMGGKRDAESYRRIADEFDMPAGEIVFVSDVPMELDAAREAGLQTRLCVRPGNASVESSVDHIEITDFAQLSQP